MIDLLNEIRTSNLENIKELSFRDAYQDYPVELTRLIYKTLKNEGFEYEDLYSQNVIKDVKEEGFFFNPGETNKIDFSDDFYLSFRLEKGDLRIKVKMEDKFYLSGIELAISPKKSVKEILEYIINFLEENEIKDNDTDRMDKIKELRDKYSVNTQFPKELKNLKKFVNKKYFNMYFDKTESGNLFIMLQPKFDNILPPTIDTIDTERKLRLTKINSNIVYSFQVEYLKKILDKLIEKIEAINNYIAELNLYPSGLKITISNKSGDSVLSRSNVKFKETHKRAKRKIENIEDLFKVKEMTLNEFRRHSIKTILEEE